MGGGWTRVGESRAGRWGRARLIGESDAPRDGAAPRAAPTAPSMAAMQPGRQLAKGTLPNAAGQPPGRRVLYLG